MTVAWKLDSSTKETFHRIEKEPSDGEWTSIVIKIESNKIFVSFSGVENESGQYFSSNNFSSTAWYSLITSGKIYVGKSLRSLEIARCSLVRNYSRGSVFFFCVQEELIIMSKIICSRGNIVIN